MNITRERIGELNEILTIQFNPSDYQEKVEKALKVQSKKAKIPGFRPGTVPASHVRKLYGKSILVEEVNHLLSHSLQHYLEENKIELLGNPIPFENSPLPNWDKEGDFEFQFEIGIAPLMEVEVLPQSPIPAFKIIPEKETIDSRIQNLRRAYGRMTNPEKSEKGDVLFLDLKQIDKDGQVLENGIQKKSSLRTDLVTDNMILESLLGLQKGDSGKLNLSQAYSGDAHPLGHLLDISEEEAKNVQGEFSYEVLNVNRLNPSDLDESFFLKLFPDGSVMTEDHFREKISEEIGERMKDLSDRKLDNDLVTILVKHFASVLPHQFLRKWLLSRKEDRYTEENLSETYPEFEKNLKWSLISNQLASHHKINAEPDEIVQEAKERLRMQFRMYSPEPVGKQELNEYSMKILQNREQVSMLYEEVRNKKVLDFLKNNLNIQYSDIGYEEFLKLG